MLWLRWNNRYNILFGRGGDSRARAMDSSVDDGKALGKVIKSSSLLASDIVTIPSSGTKVIWNWSIKQLRKNKISLQYHIMNLINTEISISKFMNICLYI